MLGLVLVMLIVAYMSMIMVLNTSIGLRMGYNPWRVMPVSLVWPLLYYSDRLDTWAKGGSCTLPESHPLRQD
jgi:hypothetical protein